MSRPRVAGNTRAERRRRLRSVGCQPHLLDQADATLALWVTPVKVPAGWKVMARLTDITARQAVNYAKGGPR